MRVFQVILAFPRLLGHNISTLRGFQAQMEGHLNPFEGFQCQFETNLAFKRLFNRFKGFRGWLEANFTLHKAPKANITIILAFSRLSVAI